MKDCAFNFWLGQSRWSCGGRRWCRWSGEMRWVDELLDNGSMEAVEMQFGIGWKLKPEITVALMQIPQLFGAVWDSHMRRLGWNLVWAVVQLYNFLYRIRASRVSSIRRAVVAHVLYTRSLVPQCAMFRAYGTSPVDTSTPTPTWGLQFNTISKGWHYFYPVTAISL
jgi:hypothetical protein